MNARRERAARWMNRAPRGAVTRRLCYPRRMTASRPTCWSCGAALDLDPADPVGRSETCDACDADIRCCRACAFYDEASDNACREPSADRVLEKDRGNFCGWFRLALDRAAPAGVPAAESPADAARRRLEELFKR